MQEQYAAFAWSLRKTDQATQLFEQVAAVYAKHFGKDDSATVALRAHLEQLGEISSR